MEMRLKFACETGCSSHFVLDLSQSRSGTNFQHLKSIVQMCTLSCRMSVTFNNAQRVFEIRCLAFHELSNYGAKYAHITP